MYRVCSACLHQIHLRHEHSCYVPLQCADLGKVPIVIRCRLPHPARSGVRLLGTTLARKAPFLPTVASGGQLTHTYLAVLWPYGPRAWSFDAVVQNE